MLNSFDHHSVDSVHLQKKILFDLSRKRRFYSFQSIWTTSDGIVFIQQKRFSFKLEMNFMLFCENVSIIVSSKAPEAEIIILARACRWLSERVTLI